LRDEFTLQESVTKNVAELCRVLGSIDKPLSYRRLAARLNEADGGKRSASSIQRWLVGAEPDIQSIRIMAQIAGVSFEAFALGDPAKQKRRPRMPGFTRTDIATRATPTKKKGA